MPTIEKEVVETTADSVTCFISKNIYRLKQTIPVVLTLEQYNKGTYVRVANEYAYLYAHLHHPEFKDVSITAIGEDRVKDFMAIIKISYSLAKTLPLLVEDYSGEETGFYHISQQKFIPKHLKSKVRYREFNSIETGEFISPIPKPNTYLGTHGLKTTFGVEIETGSGYIPEYVKPSMNASCIFDGSLRLNSDEDPRGGEYVTGVLRGDEGLLDLKTICYELSKRCTINYKCSVHVHLGIKPNKMSIMALTAVSLLLENELFSYMPYSRRPGQNSYCRELPLEMKSLFLDVDFTSSDSLDNSVQYAHARLYNYLTMGERIISNFGTSARHPKGDKCGYDMNSQRYCWINFIPAMFQRDAYQQKTIEFRLHSASTNYIKIRNWLLVCMSITNYAENYSYDVIKLQCEAKPLTLKTILEKEMPNYSKYLLDYYNKRYDKFNSSSPDSANQGDIENGEILKEGFKYSRRSIALDLK